jgi:hypothetical protein
VLYESCTPSRSLASELESISARIDSFLAKRSWVPLLVISAVFLLFASLKARRGMLWFDEVLTYYISALPDFHEMWNAVLNHAEAGSPFSDFVAKLSGQIFGRNTFGLRFPEIIGYLTMMLCVYAIVRRYASPLYAMVGALAGFLTYAPFYAVEARPYGLLLGLSSIALLFWEEAWHTSSWQAKVGLFASLMLAVFVHYYAVFTVAAIGAAELVRSWQRRRMDWLTWFVLVSSAAPLLYFLPLIRANTAMLDGGYAPATLSNFVDMTTFFYLPGSGIFWALLAVVTVVSILTFGMRELPTATEDDTPQPHDYAAWGAFLLTPLWVFVVGKLFTGSFHSRYGVITVIGFSILLPLCLQRLFHASRSAVLAELLVLAVGFYVWCTHSYITERQLENTRADLSEWMESSKGSQLPILVANPIMYLPLAATANNLRDLVIYTPDAGEAVRYHRASTADVTLLGLERIAPLNMPTFSEFTKSHRRFLVLWEDSPFDWVVPKLKDMGAELRVCGTFESKMLLQVDLPDGRTNTGAEIALDPACTRK